MEVRLDTSLELLLERAPERACIAGPRDRGCDRRLHLSKARRTHAADGGRQLHRLIERRLPRVGPADPRARSVGERRGPRVRLRYSRSGRHAFRRGGGLRGHHAGFAGTRGPDESGRGGAGCRRPRHAFGRVNSLVMVHNSTRMRLGTYRSDQELSAAETLTRIRTTARPASASADLRRGAGCASRGRHGARLGLACLSGRSSAGVCGRGPICRRRNARRQSEVFAHRDRSDALPRRRRDESSSAFG